MKCKYCKNEFEKVAPKQRVCTSNECLKRFSEEVKEKEWKVKKKKLKEELQTVSELTKIAQKYCNDYIRLRDTGKNCISCDKELKGKFDAGHYFNTTYSNVRFNEFNIHGQCTVCNHRKHGNLLEYQIGIEKRVGGIELFDLHQKAHEKRTYTKSELREITEYYKKKIKDFKKTLAETK
jgi:hypothetical protein